MIDHFEVYCSHEPGTEIYAHRPHWTVPILSGDSIMLDRIPLVSTEMLFVTKRKIFHGETLVVAGGEVRNRIGVVVGHVALAPLPRDHLLASALERETAKIGKGYVPTRLEDIDKDRLWESIMEMGRGG